MGVDGGEVEVELAGVLGFEVGGLELDDDVAFKARVGEEEVDKELVPRHFQPRLAAEEGEAGAQL